MTIATEAVCRSMSSKRIRSSGLVPARRRQDRVSSASACRSRRRNLQRPDRPGQRHHFCRGRRYRSARPAELQGTVERAIFKIDTDGKNLRKVVNGSYPKISPKGDVLAYLSGGQVWLINLDSVNAVGKKLFQSRGVQNSIR